MNSVEIKDQKNTLNKRCHEIVDACKAEIREMTDEEKQEFEDNKKKIEELNKQLEELQKRLNEYDEKLPKDKEEEDNKEEKNKRSNFKIMEKSNFSLLKAVRDIANNRSLDATAEAVVNAGAEEMRAAGLSFGGQIQLPVENRDITVATEHDDVVGLEMQSMLEPLRAKNVLINAGAKYLTGLVGDVQVPIMGATSVSWEGETGSFSGDSQYTSVKLTPKRLTAYVDVTKQFLAQTSADAEAMLKADLVNAINGKLEATILGSASGTTTQPAGMFSGADIKSGITAFSALTDLEADVEDANVNGECVYVMSNKAKAVARAMSKSTKNTQLVMEGNNIDGVAVYNTSHVAGKNFIYGDFSNLAIGQWGAIDLTVDPYTVAKDGKVRIVVNAFFDAKVLRDGAFAYGSF